MNEEILKRLDELAAKLGVTAGHLWQVLIKQVRINAFEDLAIGIGSLGLAAVAIWCTRYVMKSEGSGGLVDEEGGALFVLFVLAVISAFVFFIVGVAYLYAVPTEFLNPEYVALHEVLKAVGK